ncbi:hypothetical protein ACSQ67_010859 [Phaseolus vulgaris]
MGDSSSSGGEAESMNSESSRGGWRSFPFVIGSTACMSFGAAGMLGNLTVYLIREFNVKSINGAHVVNVANGSSSLFPILAAIMADSFLDLSLLPSFLP